MRKKKEDKTKNNTLSTEYLENIKRNNKIFDQKMTSLNKKKNTSD